MHKVAQGLEVDCRTESLPRAAVFSCLLLLGLLYALFFHSYRAYEIDNPWYLSFSRNLWVLHSGRDTFLNGVFPDGMGGTEVFGRIPALLQGLALNPLGWMPIPSMLLSTAVVLAGLGIWYAFLRDSGFAPRPALACVLALGLSEPFVGMAERFRYEPYSFLLLALALWMAGKGWAWQALTFSLLAFETEPAAGMVFLSVSLFLLRSPVPRRRVMLGCGIAGLLFAGMYAVLHPHVLAVLRSTDWHRGSSQRESGGFLRAYFLQRKRHWAELLLFTGCAAVFIKHLRQAPSIVLRMAEIVLLVSFCSLAMRWPTPAYMVFWYPAALVVALWSFSRYTRFAWALPLVMASLMLPQYAALVWINRGEGYRPADLQLVRQAIARSEIQADLDQKRTRIMGDYSLWFAHPEGYRALARTTMTSLDEEDLFLCFDQPLRPPAMVDPIVRYCSDVRQRTNVRDLTSLSVRGHLLHVLEAVHPGSARGTTD